jgi:hypothetical protein
MPQPCVEVLRGLGRQLRVAEPASLRRSKGEREFYRGVVRQVESGDLCAPRATGERNREEREVALAERGGEAARLCEEARKLDGRECPTRG